MSVTNGLIKFDGSEERQTYIVRGCMSATKQRMSLWVSDYPIVSVCTTLPQEDTDW